MIDNGKLGWFLAGAAIGATPLMSEAPLLDISATTLRTRCAEGRSVRFQTPDAVIDYITSNALYR